MASQEFQDITHRVELEDAPELVVWPATEETSLAMERLQVNWTAAQEALVKPMPAGWIACRAPCGEVYYHCLCTGASQWSHPSKAWADGCQKDVDKVCTSFVKALGEDGKKPLQRGNGAVKSWSCGFVPPEVAPAGAAKCANGCGKLTFNGKPGEKCSKGCASGYPLKRVIGDSLSAPQHSIYDAHSRHVNLPTPQSLFSDAAASIKREDLQSRVFALHGLLTTAEAASYATSAEATGFRNSDVGREFPHETRENARLVHFSDALAAALWRRLAPALAHRDIYLMQPMGFGAEGRWKPVGVNPCFRISRYSEGGHFAPHHDGMYVNDNGECSIYSLVLYLNDEFDGGELELLNKQSGPQLFKPCAGSAVLFPHDVFHAGRPVVKGTKYIARSELMFRCVEAAPAPSTPALVSDPLFQKMASLYEQVGDLAAAGDPIATTEIYQQALGIQIAHQGTVALAPPASPLPLPGTSLAQALSFLSPRAGLNSGVSHAWRRASCLGALWRCHFRRRWPDADDVIEDDARKLDPELKDWLGMYRQKVMLSQSHVCTVFLNSCINLHPLAKKPLEPYLAQAQQRETGIGWDRFLKQRGGWMCGNIYAKNCWLAGGEIDWRVLPELFAFAFTKMELRPSEHAVLIPALPGVWTSSTRARLVRILSSRFGVPRVHFVPTPLCALLARGLWSGIVVWECDLGENRVCCYHEGKEVASLGPFTLQPDLVGGLCQLLKGVSETLDPNISPAVLQHVVLSCQNNPAGWDPSDAIQSMLERISPNCFTSSSFHSHMIDDVMLGANVLASSTAHLVEYEVAPEEAACWEWRHFVDGQWQRLPAYIAGVLEGALRSGKRYATAQIDNTYLHADLETFTFGSGTREQLTRELHRRRRSNAVEDEDDPKHYVLEKAFGQLTRFLRGRPSVVPDRRTPADMEALLKVEITQAEQVVCTDAVSVSTLTGKVVFSVAKGEAQHLSVRDVLEEVGKNMHQDPKQLTLLAGERAVASTDTLQSYLEEEGTTDFQVLVCKAPPPKKQNDISEVIPEDVPGEHSEVEENIRKYMRWR